MNKRSFVPKKMTERKTDIVYRNAFIDVDSITYTIPEEYEIEYIPESFIMNTEFGNYSIAIESSENTFFTLHLSQSISTGRAVPEYWVL